MKYSMAASLLIALTILGVAMDGCHCKVVQFIFGDSLSDVGNNEYLSRSLARANLPWYGIDFGNGLPNGRYTNGRTVADIIGDHMGLPRPPAFLDPTLTEDIIMSNGVNFASGGGGILNETATYFIQRFSLYKQLELFGGVQELIRQKIGPTEAEKFFQQSQYVVAMGSNDFINNYLMPISGDSWTYNDDTFLIYLVGTLRNQLKLLHSLGARQVIVFGLGPMGCIPLQRVLSTSGDCQQKSNNLALKFNQLTSKLVMELSNTLPNASIRFGDAYDVVNDVISNPSKYGFDNADSPCCSFGKIRPALTCVPASRLCKDRSKYMFWDEYHPSDSANVIVAKEMIKKLGFGKVNQAGAPSPQPSLAPSDAPVAAPAPSPNA
ncbi:GDSL lipase/esterase [Dillenia turbinata]|uniref:GDSL lipase/esterase n=1 Tax=Dillenia turbinata TaxID=194707 RepID=A0AAN8YZH3_9MAGN